jgi:hypothetical protein
MKRYKYFLLFGEKVESGKINPDQDPNRPKESGIRILIQVFCSVCGSGFSPDVKI